MSDKIKVALLGLGTVGETFAEHFLEKIQEYNRPVEIVAVADHHVDSPIALGFAQNNVPVFKDALDVIKLGENVDIIFDLSGNPKLTQELRIKLLETKNRHTLIAPPVFANLLWYFFDSGKELPKEARAGYSA